MKTLLQFTLVVLFGLYTNQANSQEDRFKLNLSDINFQSGALHHVPNFITTSEFYELNPSSSILNKDYTEYSSQWRFGQTGPSGSISLGFEFESRPALGFRVGLSSWQRSYFEAYYSNRTPTPYDTLVSAETDYPIYIELNHDEYTFVQLSGTFVNLDVAFEFKTITDSRWQLRTGIGFQTGVILDTYSDIQSGGSYATSPNYNYIYSELQILSEPTLRETFQNNNHFNMAIYAPLNIGFALGKKNNFWRKIQLNVQATPTFNYISIKDIKAADQMTFSHSYGIRYLFD